MENYECPRCGSKDFEVEHTIQMLNLVCRQCGLYQGEVMLVS